MIIQLTEAQRSVLEPACMREDRRIFPIAAALKGGASGNVCKSLLKRGLVEEAPATDTSTVWRHDEDGTAVTLRATDEGARAINCEGPEMSSVAPGKPEDLPVPLPRVSRQDTLLQLLREKDGATIAQMSEATGWQAHSVRGALSGVIGKMMGLKVVSERLADRGRVYRLG